LIPEARKGLKDIIKNLKQYGLLIPCQSLCNTSLPRVQKSNGEGRLVQDFRLVNEAVIPIHPVVLNPYTLLPQNPEESESFT
jgi:hypothetical protein